MTHSIQYVRAQYTYFIMICSYGSEMDELIILGHCQPHAGLEEPCWRQAIENITAYGYRNRH